MFSYMLAIGMEGLCCMFIPLLHLFSLLVPCVALYGYFDGAYVALIPVVTSDVVGSTYLTSALGVVYFLHAIPYLVSPPIGGKCPAIFLLTVKDKNVVRIYLCGLVLFVPRDHHCTSIILDCVFLFFCFFQYISPVSVSPGWLVDRTGNYETTFFLCGASFMFCSVILAASVIFRRCRRSKSNSAAHLNPSHITAAAAQQCII